MSAATCEPPPEHRGHEFHWLRLGDEKPEPANWHLSGDWMLAGSSLLFTARHMAEQGWRYVAPAIPPQEGEGG